MIAPVNEFAGFEIFVPTYGSNNNRIQLTFSKTGCRLSKLALSHLKYPEYVNIFFDRSAKRMMISAADKKMQNTFHLSKQGHCPNTIGQKCVIDELVSIYGANPEQRTYFSGEKAKYSQPAVIFDLTLKAGS